MSDTFDDNDKNFWSEILSMALSLDFKSLAELAKIKLAKTINNISEKKNEL